MIESFESENESMCFYVNLDEELLKLRHIYGDGIHFTKYGYEQFGLKLADH